MDIDIDNPREILDILQKLIGDEILTKMESIIRNVIENELDKLEQLKTEIVRIFPKLYGTNNQYLERQWGVFNTVFCRGKSNINKFYALLSLNNTINSTYQYNRDSNKLNKMSNNIENNTNWNKNNKIVSNQTFSVIDAEKNFNKWNKTNKISTTQSINFQHKTMEPII